MPSGNRLAFVFSCLGHAYIHLFTAFYFVIVLALQRDWGTPYHELIGLWTLGALLVGVAALPAGWLGDRWSASGMMTVFFIGMGLCAILAGLSDSQFTLLLTLAGIGLFAAIYHPVGIPWLVRNGGENKGKLLGLNGIFGSLGAALAGAVAGFLIDLASWRSAFIVPGIVSLITGIGLWIAIVKGRVHDGSNDEAKDSPLNRKDTIKVFLFLLFIMFFSGIIYHATQSALPKLFEQRHDGLIGEGVFGIGMLVALVYTLAGLMQYISGYLADRYDMKTVYLGALALQIPFLWLAASFSGIPLALVAMIMVMAGASALPAENMMLAHFTPSHRHGLAFGAKFVLTFGAAPAAVQLVARINAASGGFYWVFITLSLIAILVSATALCLPRPDTHYIAPSMASG